MTSYSLTQRFLVVLTRLLAPRTTTRRSSAKRPERLYMPIVRVTVLILYMRTPGHDGGKSFTYGALKISVVLWVITRVGTV